MKKKLRKITSVCLAVIMMLGTLTIAPISVSAAVIETSKVSGEYVSGDYKYELYDSGDVGITKYTGTATNITTPSKLDGHKVIAIDQYAFQSTEASVITVSEGIERIERFAFSSCKNLTKLNLPASLYSINDGTYNFVLYCDNLTEINVSQNNESYSSQNGVLFSKNKETLYFYPQSKSGESYTIPDCVKEVYFAAFTDNTKYLKHINLGAKIENIIGIFYCENLESITVNGDNKNYSSIDGVLFNKDKSLLLCYPRHKNTSKYVIPNTVTDCRGFNGCNTIEEITFSNKMTYIRRADYAYCTNLKKINLSDSISSIYDGAFFECKKLTSVKIPKTVTEIGKEAFGYYDENNHKKISGFTISGYSGTVAEKYANDNGFEFVNLDHNVTPTITKLENTSDGIKISWNKVSGAYGYRLYYKYPGKDWKRFKDTTATSFTDTGVSAGRTETYTIRCIDKDGNTISGYNSSGWSKKYEPITPTITKLENTSDGIKISWNKIAGVYGYRLYYKYPGKDWKRFKDTTTTSFTDTGVSIGRTETYTIRCIDKNGNTVSGYNSGGWSQTYSLPNSIPQITKLENTSNGIKISWNKVAGVYGYRLYYKYPGKDWKRFKDTTSTSFTDTGVSAGRTETYTIRCIDKNGNTISGYYSNGWSKKYEPVAPTITKLENTSNGVKISWNKVPGVYGYRLYYKYPGQDWKRFKDTSGTSFTDAGVKAGRTETYTIRCIDKDGNTISGYNPNGWSITY